MATSLQKATEPPHAPRNTPRASATTTRLCPINQDPIPRVSGRLQPAYRHTRRRPANSPPAASYGARHGHTPLAEPKSLPPDASNTENHVAALVEAIPYTHATAVPVNAATACLQPTQQ